MRTRTTATVVLAGAVMFLTAGCGFISAQSTTEQYAASDGFDVNVGKIEIRNAIVFTDNGDDGSLSVTLLNTSSSSANVNFQYKSMGSDTTVTIPVAANSTVTRGTTGGDAQTILNGIGEQPGSLLKVFVQYGSTTGKNFSIPVLDGSLKEYATLLPSPVPTTDPNVLPVVPTPESTAPTN